MPQLLWRVGCGRRKGLLQDSIAVDLQSAARLVSLGTRTKEDDTKLRKEGKYMEV